MFSSSLKGQVNCRDNRFAPFKNFKNPEITEMEGINNKSRQTIDLLKCFLCFRVHFQLPHASCVARRGYYITGELSLKNICR